MIHNALLLYDHPRWNEAPSGVAEGSCHQWELGSRERTKGSLISDLHQGLSDLVAVTIQGFSACLFINTLCGGGPGD